MTEDEIENLKEEAAWSMFSDLLQKREEYQEDPDTINSMEAFGMSWSDFT